MEKAIFEEAKKTDKTKSDRIVESAKEKFDNAEKMTDKGKTITQATIDSQWIEGIHANVTAAMNKAALREIVNAVFCAFKDKRLNRGVIRVACAKTHGFRDMISETSEELAKSKSFVKFDNSKTYYITGSVTTVDEFFKNIKKICRYFGIHYYPQGNAYERSEKAALKVELKTLTNEKETLFTEFIHSSTDRAIEIQKRLQEIEKRITEIKESEKESTKESK